MDLKPPMYNKRVGVLGTLGLFARLNVEDFLVRSFSADSLLKVTIYIQILACTEPCE